MSDVPLIAGPWELFELSNEALFLQRGKLDVLLMQGDCADKDKAKYRNWLDIIDTEMKERGIAYSIGLKLASMASTSSIATAVPDSNTPSHPPQETGLTTSDATRCDSSSAGMSKFENFFSVRPPWFVDPVCNENSTGDKEDSNSAIDALPPQSRPHRGLWDGPDDDEIAHESNGDVCRRPKLRKGSNARGSKIGIVNHLGFFVIPSKKRKKRDTGAVPPPAVTLKKPPLPAVPVKRSSSSTPLVSDSTAKTPIVNPFNARRSPVPARSATAVPFSHAKVSTDAKPARPLSAHMTDVTPSSSVSKNSLEVNASDLLMPAMKNTLVVDEKKTCADAAVEQVQQDDTATAEGDTGATGIGFSHDEHQEESTTVQAMMAAPVPVSSDTASPDVVRESPSPLIPTEAPRSDDGVPLTCASVAQRFPEKRTEEITPAVATIEPVLFETPSVTKRSIAPPILAPLLLTPEILVRTTTTTEILRQPACAAAPIPHTKQETRTLRPPAFPSLYAMMLDPTYFFTFDTQPPPVRLEAMRMLRRALGAWLHEPMPDGASTGVVSMKRRRSTAASLEPLKKGLPSKGATLGEGQDRTAIDEDVDHLKEDRSMWYLVQTSHPEVYELITGVLDNMDVETETSADASLCWREVPAGAFATTGGGGQAQDNPSGLVPSCWNLWWTWGKPRVQQASVWLKHIQYVNHIPKSWHLTRKDSLKASVQRYCTRGDTKTFNVVPTSFQLPREYVEFAKCFAERRGTWIMKTIGMSRGRGISLVSDIAHVVYDAPVVLQQYVDRPLVIDGGYKFDMRLYVLVTSFQPTLEAFISTLGFARIAAFKYEQKDLTNKYAHLTNTSISSEAKTQMLKSGQRVDTKWTLSKLAMYMNKHRPSGGPTWDVLWNNHIKTAVLKALVCVEDLIPPAPSTFEVFGFDVLLDADYRAWILEVNASPSLEVDCSEDEEVKPQLIEDVVTLMNIPMIDRRALMRSLDRRLAPLASNSSMTATSKRKPVSMVDDPDQSWAAECNAILGSWRPRELGVEPVPVERLGNFEVLSPSPAQAHLEKQKRNI